MGNNDKRRIWKRIINVVFAIIICVPVVLVIISFISGIWVIAYEDVLYAKELNNPYVDSNFTGWHTASVGQETIIIPEIWEIEIRNDVVYILQDEKLIAYGTLIHSQDPTSNEDKTFLAKILEAPITETAYGNIHSLLGSNFGKLYINKSNQPQGYYLKLGNHN